MSRKPVPTSRMEPGPSKGIILGESIGRRPPRPDRRTLFGSFAFHIVLVGAILTLGAISAHKTQVFEQYAVKIYSPPPQVEGTPPPKPEVAAPTIVQQPKPEPKPTPPKRVNENKRPEQTPTEKPPEKKPEPVKGENPDPKSAGGENLDVDISGQEFPFPEYLANIIRQMDRYFRWNGNGNPSAVVAFAINRDGSVGNIRVVERSGDILFDAETMSAVEIAGKRGAFGPLPEGWVQDRLWVRFRFIPPGR